MNKGHFYYILILLGLCWGCQKEGLFLNDAIPVYEPQLISHRSDQAVLLEWRWLTWDATIEPARKEPEYFEVLASDVSASQLEVIATLGRDQSTYNIENLDNEKPWYFAVRALAEGGIATHSRTVMTVPGTSEPVTPLIPEAPFHRLEASWSPVGNQVAVAVVPDEYSSASNFSGEGIYIFDLDAQTSLFLGEGRAPDWSPDGEKIACYRSLDNPPSMSTFISTYDLKDGGYVLHRGGDGFFHSPEWSVDGRTLIFLAENDSTHQYDIYRIPIGGSEPEIRLSLSPEQQSPKRPVPTPDGLGISYSKWVLNENAYFLRIFNQAFSGGESIEIFASIYNDTQPAYDPSGERLAFISDRSGYWAIWVKNLLTGGYAQLTDAEAPTILVDEGKLEWAPSGDRLLFTAKSAEGYANIYSIPVK